MNFLYKSNHKIKRDVFRRDFVTQNDSSTLVHQFHTYKARLGRETNFKVVKNERKERR